MNFNVPQFIDIEDKIAFRLTAKQLGWFALAGVAMFFCWNLLSQPAFYLASFLIVLSALAFAFLRPNGLSLAGYIAFGIIYLFKPKNYYWGKEEERAVVEKKKKWKNDSKATVVSFKDKKTLKEVGRLAEILDKKSDL